MSLPPLNPEKSLSGIAVDPTTLERVIPESKRPDGSTRKQIKIRPGFTPQEDIKRFRGTRQAQQDANALPKGHIIGWVPPPSASKAPTSSTASKNAKKHAKRKEKREKEKVEVPDNWEDDVDEPSNANISEATSKADVPESSTKTNRQTVSASADIATLSDKLEKLDV